MKRGKAPPLGCLWLNIVHHRVHAPALQCNGFGESALRVLGMQSDGYRQTVSDSHELHCSDKYELHALKPKGHAS